MSLAALLQGLLSEGRIRLSGPVGADPAEEAEAADLLERSFRNYRQTVAGPLLPLDRDIMLAASRLVFRAAWYLTSRNEPPASRPWHCGCTVG